MKVRADDVAIWMKNPVTMVLLESIKDELDASRGYVLCGNCVTTEMYQFKMGQLEALELFSSPIDMMTEKGYITEEEPNDE